MIFDRFDETIMYRSVSADKSADKPRIKALFRRGSINITGILCIQARNKGNFRERMKYKIKRGNF